MAEMATYIGVTPISATLTAVAVARGVRLVRDGSGTFAVADATIRGDVVTLREGVASETIPVSPAGTPAKVPALASEAATVGALAYAAAAGKFSVTSTNAAVMGRWTLAASGDGVLGEVMLFPTA